MPEDALYSALYSHWFNLNYYECLVFNKLITGGFRVGVSALLVMRALSQVSGLDARVIAHRMAGEWEPTPDNYEKLVSHDDSAFDISKPYPFFLAHPLEGNPETLGDIAEWQAEWKWDGIRGQLVKRQGQVFVWSRGEELISGQFPEIVAAAADLRDCVLDGEVLAARDGKVLPFNALQKRLGRKIPGNKIIAETPRQLVTFAKAYSGLNNEEITEVDAFIRKNTLEKFGPVRTVRPDLVFELAFEGIQRSKRHKSGVAVRFPRMVRIRRDKKIEEADSLDTILRMLDTMTGQ